MVTHPCVLQIAPGAFVVTHPLVLQTAPGVCRCTLNQMSRCAPMCPRDYDDELKAFIMSHPENFTYKQVSFFRQDSCAMRCA